VVADSAIEDTLGTCQIGTYIMVMATNIVGFKCIWRSHYSAQFYLHQEASILKSEMPASSASHFLPHEFL